MSVASALQNANIVVVVLFLVALLVGFLLGKREGKTATVVAIIAVGLIVLLIGGTWPLRIKIGEVVTNRAWLIASMLDAGLLGGFAAGRKLSHNVKNGAFLYLMVTLLLGGFAYGRMQQGNAQIIEIANQIGLDKKPAKIEPVANKDCPENLKSLYNAMAMYAQDWDRLPPPEKWMENEELVSKVQKNEWLHCPAVSNRNDDKFGYAYNEHAGEKPLNGKPLKEMPEAAKTPLIYDSTDLGKSAHDTGNSLPRPGRHAGTNNILYCDGHVETVAPK